MSMVFQPWRCWYRHKDNPCPKCWEWMQKQVPRCETMEAALSDLAKEIKHRLQLLMQRFPKRRRLLGPREQREPDLRRPRCGGMLRI